MTKPAKPKNSVGTKVKNRHNKAKTGWVDPLAKFKDSEHDAYSRLLLAEDQYEQMQTRVLNRGANLPHLSLTVLEAMVRGIETGELANSPWLCDTIVNLPSYEKAQFTEWCEKLGGHRAYMDRLRSKCKRILDALEVK